MWSGRFRGLSGTITSFIIYEALWLLTHMQEDTLGHKSSPTSVGYCNNTVKWSFAANARQISGTKHDRERNLICNFGRKHHCCLRT